jgi:hypothetical protein
MQWTISTREFLQGLFKPGLENLYTWIYFTRNIGPYTVLPVLVVEEAGIPGENHRPWASNW